MRQHPSDPTIADNKTSNGTETGTFTSSITGLSPGATYHVRAYATNSVGTSYGSDVSLKTSYESAFYVNGRDEDCGNKTPCYDSIQNAVNDAPTGALILIRAGTYSESINLNEAKSLTLQGGWDVSFSSQTENTTLQEAPKAPQGSLIIREMSIRP